jgi:ketosteroid isomerase-like protein
MTPRDAASTAPAAVDVVTAYAAAKSRADVDEALRHCSDDLVVQTVPFQVTVEGKEANRAAFTAFFGVFPDYDVELEAMTGDGDWLAGWGTLRATMRGAIGDVKPTDRRFVLSFACIWRVADGLLAEERFFFDLHQMCEQLEIAAGDVMAAIRGRS